MLRNPIAIDSFVGCMCDFGAFLWLLRLPKIQFDPVLIGGVGGGGGVSRVCDGVC